MASLAQNGTVESGAWAGNLNLPELEKEESGQRRERPKPVEAISKKRTVENVSLLSELFYCPTDDKAAKSPIGSAPSRSVTSHTTF